MHVLVRCFVTLARSDGHQFQAHKPHSMKNTEFDWGCSGSFTVMGTAWGRPGLPMLSVERCSATSHGSRWLGGQLCLQGSWTPHIYQDSIVPIVPMMRKHRFSVNTKSFETPTNFSFKEFKKNYVKLCLMLSCLGTSFPVRRWISGLLPLWSADDVVEQLCDAPAHMLTPRLWLSGWIPWAYRTSLRTVYGHPSSC